MTPSAREVLALAHNESRRLRHPYIGTEHLALALMAQTKGPVAAVLQSLRIDTKGMRATLEAVAQPGDAPAESPRPYTSRTKKSLELAKESALSFQQSEVGAEYILVGVLREAKGLGAQILLHHGLSEVAVIEQVRRTDARPDS